MTNKKKILISFVIIFTIIICISMFFNKSSKTVLETYMLNEQGLMRNDKIILDEKFDEKGNLLYYKYKAPNGNDVSEFNFKYKYDDSNRITEVSLDDRDYIQIEYGDNNKITKMYETISTSSSIGKDVLQLTFNYLEDDEIIVNNNIIRYKDSENEYKEHYTIRYKNINYRDKDCTLITETDDNENSIIEIAYEKNLKAIDFSNFYELLNIIPLGYSTDDNSFKNTQSYGNSLLMMTPVFFNGNVVYVKNKMRVDKYSDYKNTGADYYYDSNGRLLKHNTYGYETNQTINCMYKSINSKEYYEYRLVKIYSDSSTEYKYVENIIYLDDNNNICKKETLKNNQIDEKEYNSKFKEFEKYFEKENV